MHYRTLLCFYSILLFLAYPQTLLYLLLFNLRTPSGISLLPLLLCVPYSPLYPTIIQTLTAAMAAKAR